MPASFIPVFTPCIAVWPVQVHFLCLPSPTTFGFYFAGMVIPVPVSVPPPTTQSEVLGIGRIKRVGNVVSVTAVMQNYLRRTADGSTFTSSLHEFEWQKFQLLNGADAALQSLPANIRDRIKTTLESKATAEEVELGREEILFGGVEESALGTAAFFSAFSSSSAFGDTVRLEIPMQGTNNIWGTQCQRIFTLVFLLFLICVALLKQGGSRLF